MSKKTKKDYIYDSFKIIEKQTNGLIKFKPKTSNDKPYINFTLIKKEKKKNKKICGYAPVGMRSDKPNKIYIKCFNILTIIHELCHSLGLRHEHQRPDRNKYCRILRILSKGSEKKKSINRRNKFLEHEFKTKYDRRSITHYTMPENPSSFLHMIKNFILDYTKLSKGDVEKINILYNN